MKSLLAPEAASDLRSAVRYYESATLEVYRLRHCMPPVSEGGLPW